MKNFNNHNFQIFIQSSDLRIPTQTLALEKLNPELTLQDLKFSVFPQHIRKIHAPNSLYFTCNGRLLPDSTNLLNSKITPFSTIVLHQRILGGGGDGGATGAESRDCYLNMYAVKKPDKIDPNEIRLSKWLNCTLSNEPLKHPVVIDKLGNLFNKQALVEALLKKRVPKQFGYIKGLKDMIPIELSAIPGLEERDDGTQFQCPITGLEFNGKYKFFALRSCGHVLSGKALKEVKSSACLVCHKEFSEIDRIVINGTEEEVAALRERMEEEKAKVKDNKKGKMVKNGNVGEKGMEVLRLSGKKHEIEDRVVEKVSGKVKVNGKVGANGRMVETKDGNHHGMGNAKRFKATDIAPPNATKEVYASIFTSSKKSELRETYSCRSLPLGRN